MTIFMSIILFFMFCKGSFFFHLQTNFRIVFYEYFESSIAKLFRFRLFNVNVQQNNISNGEPLFLFFIISAVYFCSLFIEVFMWMY